MADKHHTPTRRFYEIWRRHAQDLSQRKQQNLLLIRLAELMNITLIQ